METFVGHGPTCFVGRDSFLQELHEMLRRERQVVISAPAGMGKTTVVAEYARRFSEMYEWILYLNLASTASWLADSLELAERLALSLPPGEQNFATINQALQNWLAQHPNTLLIIDNVGAITPPVIAEPTNSYMLLLTRNPTIAAPLALIHLAPLEAEEGACLLLYQSGQLAVNAPLEQAAAQSRSIALTLVSAMDGLPLALDLAGAYIRTTRRSLREFLAMYRDYQARLVQLKVAQNSSIDAIAITYSLSALYVKKTLPRATELLRICAVLAPLDIPRELFLQGARELTPELQELARNPALLDEALMVLRPLNFLGVDAASGALSMQMTVQETLCQAQQPEKRNSLITCTLLAFSHLLATQEQARPAARMHVVAHILHLARLSSEWVIPSEAVANTYSWAASLLWEQRLIQDAELLLRKALMIWERVLGSGHETVIVATRNLGTLNALLKNYAEAETLVQHAMLARSRTLGVSHPDVLLCLLDLASIYAEQGKDRETRACYLEVLKVGESTPGREHPLLVVAAHKLAMLAFQEEEYAEAQEYYKRVLPLYEARLGMADRTTQACLEQMVIVLVKQGNYAEAEVLLQRLLPVYEATLGIEDGRAQGCLEQLADVLAERGNYAEAEELLQRLLTVKERASGIEDPDTRTLLQKLAGLALMQEEAARAEDIYQRLLAFCETASGQEQNEVRDYLGQLAFVYLLQGRADEADNIYRRLS